MKTGLPSAIVYGWHKRGEFNVKTTKYANERLFEDVKIISLDTPEQVFYDVSKWRPDIVIVIGGAAGKINVNLGGVLLKHKIFQIHEERVSEQNLANFILEGSTEAAISIQDHVYDNREEPLFSVFTPAYQTGERILRAYQSLRGQTYQNWEWVVVDDSPSSHTETWNLLTTIAQQDFRVRPIRMRPNSGGNIGEVKHRAAMMCNGMWLVELDHDDQLISTFFKDVLDGSLQYPDAGFIYTNCAEPYEDGQHRQYTDLIGPREVWYGNPQNRYVWGFGGHEWQTADNKEWLCHILAGINPKTIRYNIGMPNHARIWRRDIYHQIGGHNRSINVADDFELIVRTFLHTRFLHINKLLYLQWNNRSSTVDWNGIDINRRARQIRDIYDLRIHNRILELGYHDWEWDDSRGRSREIGDRTNMQWGEGEQKMNYDYE